MHVSKYFKICLLNRDGENAISNSKGENFTMQRIQRLVFRLKQYIKLEYYSKHLTFAVSLRFYVNVRW